MKLQTMLLLETVLDFLIFFDFSIDFCYFFDFNFLFSISFMIFHYVYVEEYKDVEANEQVVDEVDSPNGKWTETIFFFISHLSLFNSHFALKQKIHLHFKCRK